MESKDSPTERSTQGLGRGSLTTLQKRGKSERITINQEINKPSFGKLEKDDINTFGGRSEFFGGMYPMMALGDISSTGGLDTECTSLRQRILKIGLIGFSWEHQKILFNQPIEIYC